MTIADFFYQAGFWQWVGIILLVGALTEIRIFTINKRDDE